MNPQKSERLFARILLKYLSNGNRPGREIAYIYNREAFDSLNIEKQVEDDSKFISIGDIIMLEGYKCKVKNINSFSATSLLAGRCAIQLAIRVNYTSL